MKDYKTIEINYDDSNNLDLEYIKSLCDDDILYVNIRQKYTTDETVYIKKLNMLVFKHYQKFSIYKVYTKHFNIIPTNDYIIVDENDNILIDDIFRYVLVLNNICVLYKNTNQLQIYDKDLKPLIKDKIYTEKDKKYPHLHKNSITGVVNENSLCGVIDYNGNVLVDFEYALIDTIGKDGKFHLNCYKNRTLFLEDDLIENQKLLHNLKMINESL